MITKKGASKEQTSLEPQRLHHQQMCYMKLNTTKAQTYCINKREYSSTMDQYVFVVTLVLRNHFHKLVATNAFHLHTNTISFHLYFGYDLINRFD